MTILDLLNERARRMEADIAFVAAVLRVPTEWLPRLVRVVVCDGAWTLYVGHVPISRHAIRWIGLTVYVESTWFGGLPGTDIQRAIERVDREEAQDLDDHCRALTTEDFALYGRIRR